MQSAMPGRRNRYPRHYRLWRCALAAHSQCALSRDCDARLASHGARPRPGRRRLTLCGRSCVSSPSHFCSSGAARLAAATQNWLPPLALLIGYQRVARLSFSDEPVAAECSRSPILAARRLDLSVVGGREVTVSSSGQSTEIARRDRSTVPYGVAIAAAGVITLT